MTSREERAESRYGLRARLRPVALTDRERACGVRCVDREGAQLVATTSSKSGQRWDAKWRGVLRCGKWTCPVCAEKRRVDAGRAVVASCLNAGGRWQMLTLTIKHGRRDSLKTTLHGLAKAWRETRQGGAVQRLWKCHVSASVRAFEVTYGKANGWHPHVHVLLRTKRWDASDTSVLLSRFQHRVGGVLSADHVPMGPIALRWSEPLHVDRSDTSAVEKVARYVSKLGAEVAGLGKADAEDARDTWRVARLAASGDVQAQRLWHEYAGAVRGRRMVELDDRAARFAVAAAAPAGLGTEGESPSLSVESVQLLQEDLRALRSLERREPAVLRKLVSDVERSASPRETVELYLRRATGGHDAPEPSRILELTY